jgi:hypothetical protein
VGSPVACQVFVSGGRNPADYFKRYSMFEIELKPKGYVFPKQEEDDAVFQIGNAAGSVEDLRSYLKAGVDVFDGQQNWFYLDDAELDKYVRVLPSPFDDPDAQVELSFSEEDVVFDSAAQLMLGFYDKAFSELELSKLDVDELRVILAVKGGTAVGGRKKAELVDAILQNQKAKGLNAVRVKQTSLVEVFV